MTCDIDAFHVTTSVAAWVGSEQIFTREWSFSFPRDHRYQGWYSDHQHPPCTSSHITGGPCEAPEGVMRAGLGTGSGS
jgi:hypothetical protein